MNTPHTKEPWKQHALIPRVLCTQDSPDENLLARDAEGYFIVYKIEDAARIVACVNALAGMNPEAVKDLADVLEAILACPDDYRRGVSVRLPFELEARAKAALEKLKAP